MTWRQAWILSAFASIVSFLFGIWFNSDNFIATGAVFILLLLFLSIPAVNEFDSKDQK